MARRLLISDMPLEDLAVFQRDAPTPEGHVIASLPAELYACLAHAALTYGGPGWVGNRWRQIECRSTSGAYWLGVQGVGRFVIAAGEGGSTLIETQTRAPTRDVVQTVLGPPMLLALALQGTWCLHASAALYGQNAVAFVAGSGDGKSTLAASLGKGDETTWRPLADDLLPIAMLPGGGAPVALPHFPQFKLAAHAQPAVGMPEHLPLGAIYVLGQSLPGQDTIEIRPLNGQSAAISVVRHTMGSGLFDQTLLVQNLTFAGEVALRIPVRRLIYPRRRDALPEVRDRIAADLETLGSTNRRAR